MKCERIPDSVHGGGAGDRRREPRQVTIMRVARIVGPERQELCLVRNLSANGLQARVYRARHAGDVVDVEFKCGQILRGTVAWTRGFIIGVRFHAPADLEGLLESRWAGEAMFTPPRPVRVNVHVFGILRIGAHRHAVRVHDISQGGAKLALGELIERGPAVLTLPGLPHLQGTIRWQRNELAGIAFNEPVAVGLLANWIEERQSRGLRLCGSGQAPATDRPALRAGA
ncbi:MAG: PilZ domain-containing protein [Sphingomonadaceae bacterium]|nr:PilZ domain-containing protein [Sphingomonadaceae bacterium]